MIEYTLMNVLILELKIYCGPDKFYGRSKFGHYDEVKDRAPYIIWEYEKTFTRLGFQNFLYLFTKQHFIGYSVDP